MSAFFFSHLSGRLRPPFCFRHMPKLRRYTVRCVGRRGGAERNAETALVEGRPAGSITKRGRPHGGVNLAAGSFGSTPQAHSRSRTRAPQLLRGSSSVARAEADEIGP